MEEIKTQIDSTDLEYHQSVIKQLENSQSIVNHWMQFLSRKYKLNPYDSIGPDGLIIRKQVGSKLVEKKNEETPVIEPAAIN